MITRFGRTLVAGLSFSIAALTGCSLAPISGETGEGDATRLVHLGVVDHGFNDMPLSYTRSDGSAATLYTLLDEGVIWEAEGLPATRLDTDAREPRGRFPVVVEEDGRVYVLYWQKTKDKGDKALYFKASYDGGKRFESMRELSYGGVLGRYSFASDKKGNLATIYLDERFGSTYQIFFNRSHDFGRNWLKEDVRIDPMGARVGKFEIAGTMEPQVAYLGDTLVATWKDHGLYPGKRHSIRLLSAVSRDHGRSWEEPTIVHEENRSIVSDDHLFVHEGKLYLIGSTHAGLVAFRSTDGKKWDALAPLTGQYRGASQFTIATTPGQIHMLFVGRSPASTFELHRAAISTGDWAWAGPSEFHVRIPKGPTNSVNPDLATAPDGTLVAAWQDTLNVRPNILVNYSKDQGKSWSEPMIFEAAGKYNSKYPQLVKAGGKLALFYLRFASDVAKNKGDYRRIDLAFGSENAIDASGLSKLPASDDAARSERLAKRIHDFWGVRESGKLADIYDFYDPVFRSEVQKEKFAAQIKPMKFFAHEIKKADIRGNIADVAVAYEIEIPETQVQTQTVSLPRTKDTLYHQWVWMDGDWHMVFKPAIGGSLLQF